jgi:NAD(P)-dependent dehydrogenase (short-subunit alcohol dehydrogenase family)
MLLTNTIAVVTGATRGIGYASAIALAEAGAHVIATGRTAGALEALDDVIHAKTGQRATLVPMDLRAPDGIDILGAELFKRFGRIDALVGAAGVLGDLSPVPHLKPKTWDDVMAVNLTANYRLIRSMDPLLRLSPAGRAVFLTSGAARADRAYWGLYGASKAALEAVVGSYAAEMASTPVCVNLLNPGPTRTKMRAQAFPGEDPNTLPLAEDVAKLVVKLCDPSFTKTGQTVQFREWQAGLED